MGTISMVLTTTIVNVAIPGIMADFGMDQIHAQWLSTGFLAAMTATMLASARVVEFFGQRRAFMGALSVFVLASLLAAASWNAPVMILARVVQGLMAGLISPLALVVIFQVFPDHERGRALGLYGMGVVLAPALGPALGGVLLDLFNWRAVYLAALPFCVVGLVGAQRTMVDERATATVHFDWPGLALLGPGLALILGGLTSMGSAVEDGHAVMQMLAGGVCLLLFALREWSARHPLVSLDLLQHPRFVLACLLAMTYGAGLFGSTYLLPLLVQGVQGMSATATGLVMMPAGLALAALLPVSGRLGDHVPAHRLIIAGLLAFACALFALSASGPASGFWMIAAWILLGRLGLGLMLPALNLDALRGLPETLVQQGSGMVNFCRMLGGALGVNLFALLLESRVARDMSSGAGGLHRFYDVGGGAAEVAPGAVQALTDGFSDTFIVFGLVFIAALVPAVALGVYGGTVPNHSGRV